MKTKRSFIHTFPILFVLTIFVSCNQPTKTLENPVKIENTMKSVSLWNVLTPIEPQELLASIERVNVAIDSIGYPDAGYKLWQLKSDTLKNLRFMVEGYWPDQDGYNTIHDNEIYKTAMEAEEQIWNSVEMIQYNRYTKVVHK